MKAVRRVVRGLAVLVLPVAGCTAVEGGGEVSALCAFLVTYEGRTYSERAGVDFEVAEHIGTAVMPPCDDTPNDGEPDPATSFKAYRVVGWDPGKAIAVGTSPDDAVFARSDAGAPAGRDTE